MKKISLILCNFPNLRTAKVFAKKIVNNKYAACVSINEGITSIYIWDGKLYESKQVKVIIKADTKMYSRIEKEIVNMHPDDIPEILHICEVEGFSRFIEWVKQS